MKRWTRMIAFLTACLLLSGCGTSAQSRTPAEGITFTDDLGRTVTVSKPERVAALLGSFAHVWTLAGGTVCAAADDAWEDFQLDLPEDTVNLGGTESLSMELLFAAKPDFILASANRRQSLEWRDTLESTGIPVAYFHVTNFSDYLRMLDICTQLTGSREHYETNGLSVQSQIDAVKAKSQERLRDSEAPTVLTMRASASIISVKNSQDTVLGEILADLGCVNIADSDETLLDNLSVEQILIADPDYIFIVQRGDDAEGMHAYFRQFVADHPVWEQLTAVKSGHVYFMDKNLYGLKPNDRWGEAYEQLEEILQNG